MYDGASGNYPPSRSYQIHLPDQTGFRNRPSGRLSVRRCPPPTGQKVGFPSVGRATADQSVQYTMSWHPLLRIHRTGRSSSGWQIYKRKTSQFGLPDVDLTNRNASQGSFRFVA